MKYTNEQYIEATSRRTPQVAHATVTNRFVHLDFVNRNRHIDSMPLTMNDLRLRLTWNAAPGVAGVFPIVIEQARIEPSKKVAR